MIKRIKNVARDTTNGYGRSKLSNSFISFIIYPLNRWVHRFWSANQLYKFGQPHLQIIKIKFFERDLNCWLKEILLFYFIPLFNYTIKFCIMGLVVRRYVQFYNIVWESKQIYMHVFKITQQLYSLKLERT